MMIIESRYVSTGLNTCIILTWLPGKIQCMYTSTKFAILKPPCIFVGQKPHPSPSPVTEIMVRVILPNIWVKLPNVASCYIDLQ